MKNKIYTFLLFNMVLFCQTKELKLKDAVFFSLDKNNVIKLTSDKYEQKKYENLIAWGHFLPIVNLNWNYNHMDDDLIIDLNPIRKVIIQLQSINQSEYANIYNILNGKSPLTAEQKQMIITSSSNSLQQALPEFEETLKKKDFRSSSFSVVMPVFMGGKLLAAKKYANLEEKAAELELFKTKNEIISGVIREYLNCLMMEEVVIIRKIALEGMRNHQKRASYLFKEGVIAQMNLLRADVAVAEAERNLFEDENKKELALLSLKSLIGISGDNITLSDSLYHRDFQIDDSESVNEIYINQPILKIIQQKKEASEQKYNSDRAAFLPQVYAFGKYELYPEYLSALEPRWIVGIQANINLFNGVRDFLKLQQDKYLKSELLNMEYDTKNKISLLIHKYFKEYKNAKNRFEKLEVNLNLAKENLRVSEKRFESGMCTSLDVIDSRLLLEKIELDRVSANCDYYKSINEIFLLQGKPEKYLKIWEEGN